MANADSTIEGDKIGVVTHFYDKIGVAVIELSGNLKVGEKVRIKGKATDFEQEINSIQIEKQPIAEAKAGQSVGIKVNEPAKVGDFILRVG